MIIGLMGQKRVGKDTAGEIIAKELGGTVLAFADPIKRWCMLTLKLSEAQLWGDEKEKPFTKKWLKASKQERNEFSWVKRIADACCMLIGHDWSNTGLDRGMRQWWNELSEEPGLTPRRVMQHFGTEFVRKRLGPHFWIHHGLRIADTLLEGGKRYLPMKGLVDDAELNLNAAIFTDVRFRNEALALRCRGALIYGIERPPAFALHPKSQTSVLVKRGKQKLLLTGHASEQEQLSVPQFWLDGRIINRFKTKEEFQEVVRYVARHQIATRGPVVY